MALTGDLSLYDGLLDSVLDLPLPPLSPDVDDQDGGASETSSLGENVQLNLDSPDDLDTFKPQFKPLNLKPSASPQSKPRVIAVRLRQGGAKYVSVDDQLLDVHPAKTDISSDAGDCQSSKSMSKNAILARENRQRRKTYVNNLEKSVKNLTQENRQLKKSTEDMEDTIACLQKELAYFKSVLANETTISSLLRNISDTPNVTFKSSFQCKSQQNQSHRNEQKRKAVIAANRRLIEKENEDDACLAYKRSKMDHDYASQSVSSSSGVCLHVSNQEVSLEFCSSCSENASSAREVSITRSGRPVRHKRAYDS